MNLRLVRFEESGKTPQELLEFLIDSFRTRLEEGLHFSIVDYTLFKMEHELSIATFFLALDEDGSIAGCCSMRKVSDKVYNFEHLAVRPDMRKAGVATMLYAEAEKMASGALYICSDTAMQATSSIRWHLKQGFRKYGVYKFDGTNYTSVLLRKYLKFPLLYRYCLYTSIKYWNSCRLLRRGMRKNNERTHA